VWDLRNGLEVSRDDKAAAVFAREDGGDQLEGFAGAWADSAYRVLQTSHTFAAALMCTKATEADIEIPWSAFLVHVPDGLLVTEAMKFNRIAVNARTDGMVQVTIYNAHEKCRRLGFMAPAVKLMASDSEFENRDRCEDEDAKLALLASRLIAGLLITLQFTDNFKERDVPAKRIGRDGREAPKHRVAFVGKPLKVDCRLEIKRYLGGRSSDNSPSSVQVLVRGHYKRQVVGTGRAGRRVIWVEPYWRGPEEAPILVRPYAIGGSP
jgi:hypothetical protein